MFDGILAKLVAGSVSVTAVLVAVNLIGKVAQRMARFIRKLVHLADELAGDPESDPPRPSLVKQVAEIDRKLTDHIERGGHTSAFPVRPQPNGRGGGNRTAGGRRI
jgi:hypothetical protein